MTDTGRHAARLALLIDAENIGDVDYASPIVAKARSLGTIVVARAYGDFTRYKKWIPRLAQLDLTQIDVKSASKGKDAADFKLVVEAMDMVHTRHLDGFCIAASDGDFAALAERIHASALMLYVFAKNDAPDGYRKFAHQFFDIDKLAPKAKQPPAKSASKPAAVPGPKQSTRVAKPSKPQSSAAQKAQTSTTPAKAKADLPLAKIGEVVEANANADGWTHLGQLGKALGGAGISYKTLGYSTLKRMLQAMPQSLEISEDGRYVRRRR